MKNIKISSGWYQILKWTGLVTMFTGTVVSFLGDDLNFDGTVRIIGKMIGCMSYPLLAFLLVECFFYTKNRKKHFFRMLIIAILSEIPFDIVNESRLISFDQQNVIFELLIGFALLSFCELDYKSIYENKVFPMISWKFAKSRPILNLAVLSVKICLFGMAVLVSVLVRTYYDLAGIVLVFLLYLAKKQKSNRLVTIVAAMGLYIIMRIGENDGGLENISIIADIFLIAATLNFPAKFQRKIPTPELRFCRYFFPVQLCLMILFRWIFL